MYDTIINYVVRKYIVIGIDCVYMQYQSCERKMCFQSYSWQAVHCSIIMCCGAVYYADIM